MDPNLRTLSLSAWMSLPGFDFHTWDRLNPVDGGGEEQTDTGETAVEEAIEPSSVEKSPLQRRNLSLKQKPNRDSGGGEAKNEVQSRALISRVAKYYESYVTEMGLDKNFWNDFTVTHVFPVRIHGPQRWPKARWMVVG